MKDFMQIVDWYGLVYSVIESEAYQESKEMVQLSIRSIMFLIDICHPCIESCNSDSYSTVSVNQQHMSVAELRRKIMRIDHNLVAD